MKVTIHATLDDFIVVDGDLKSEFSHGAEEGAIAFGDGTVLRVRYDEEGVWRFKPLVIGDGAEYSIVQAPADDDDSYSDVVTLMRPDNGFGWVLHASEWAWREA